MSQQVESLLNLGHELGLPEQIMHYLMDNQAIATISDLRSITPEDILELKAEHLESLQETPDEKNLWVSLVTRQLRFLIEWLNSFHRAYGYPPQPEDLVHLQTLPEERLGIREPSDNQGLYGRYSMSLVRKASTSSITSRKSYG